MLRTKTMVMMGLVGLLLLAAWPVAAQIGEPENPPLGDGKPHRYVSEEGNFEVTWPSGCDKLRMRGNDPEHFVGEEDKHQIMVHVIVCDRDDRETAGCSVTATFDSRSPDGGEAGPEQVIARVRNALKTYGVKVVNQSPIKKEFPNGLVVEGVDVIGTGPDGTGEFKVRGLLASPDIYVLTAWSADGGVWDDPEYREFFDNFTPYLE